MYRVTVGYIDALKAIESNSLSSDKMVAERVGDALLSPAFSPFSKPMYIEAMALLLANFKDSSPPLIEPMVATVVPEYIRTRDHFKFLRSMQRAINSYRKGRDPYEAMQSVVDQIKVNTL